jgi:hypothetical protein
LFWVSSTHKSTKSSPTTNFTRRWNYYLKLGSIRSICSGFPALGKTIIYRLCPLRENLTGHMSQSIPDITFIISLS